MGRRSSSSPPPPTDAELRGFYDSLPVGRAQALTARELAEQMQMESPNADRTLRNLAQHAVEAGLLICADNDGYYVPQSSSEATETISRLEKQAKTMLTRANRMRALIQQVFGVRQEHLL